MTASLMALPVALLTEPAPAGSAPAGPTLPGLPGIAAPAGAPTWLVIAGYLFAVLCTAASSGVLVKLIDAKLTRRRLTAEGERAEFEVDEVLTRVAVTLVEPLRGRLDTTERRLREAEERVDQLRAKVVATQGEADEASMQARAAIGQARRAELLMRQWHRAIMDPAATIEWLRQLVGPDEPAL